MILSDVISKERQEKASRSRFKETVFLTYKNHIGIPDACKGKSLTYNKRKKVKSPQLSGNDKIKLPALPRRKRLCLFVTMSLECMPVRLKKIE